MDLAQSLNRRKKLILKISAVFVAILLVIVFFSSTIYNLGLPVVSIGWPRKDAIVSAVTGTGAVELTETKSLFAGVSGVVEFYGKVGDVIPAGEPLYTVRPEKTEAGGAKTSEQIALIQAENNAKDLSLQLSELDLRIAEAERQKAALTGDYSTSETLEDTSLIDSLEFQLAQWQIAYDRAKADFYAELDRQIAESRFDISQAEAAKAHAQAKFLEDAANNAALFSRQENENRDNQIESYNKAIADLQTLRESYLLELQSAEIDLRQLQNQYDDEKRNHGDSTDYGDEKNNPLALIQFDIDRAKLKIEGIQTNIDKADSAIREYEAKIEALRTETALVAEFDASEFDARLEKLRYTLAVLETERAKTEGEQPALAALLDQRDKLEFELQQAKDKAAENAEKARRQNEEEYARNAMQLENDLAAANAQIAELHVQRQRVVLSLETSQSSLNLLKSEKAENGAAETVTAAFDCVITGLAVETGAFVSKYAKIAEVGVVNSGYRVEIPLPLDAEKFFAQKASEYQADSQLLVNVPSKSLYDIPADLQTLKKETDKLTMVITFNAKGLTGGELAQTRLQTSAVSDCVLPNTALHKDSGGMYYILTVERQRNALGYGYVLQKEYIDTALILGSNEWDTALYAIMSDSAIVFNSDRYVAEGSRVRIADGNAFTNAR